MKLDFSALYRPTPTETIPKPRGQAGTVGTLAFMRVASAQDTGDTLGTAGDKAPIARYPQPFLHQPLGDEGHVCPHLSPECPHTLTAQNINEIKVSPLSPLSPPKNDDSVDALEFFEERAAILEYDGGLTRDEAEQQAALMTMEVIRRAMRAADNQAKK